MNSRSMDVRGTFSGVMKRKFEVTKQEGTIYDASAEPPCEPVPSDNPNMAATCVCISDTKDSSLGANSDPPTLPSRFLFRK